MENWGLVIYPDRGLLVDDKDTSFELKLQNVRLMLHEHSNTWFDDLVTPTWWSYTWLKEGFVTLFENLEMNMVSNIEKRKQNVFYILL